MTEPMKITDDMLTEPPVDPLAPRVEAVIKEVMGKFPGLGKASQAAAPAEVRPTDDALWDQTLRERDEYHEAADKLAAAIAKYLGVDIGEHSNLNCPWDQALDAIENARPVVPADAGEAVAPSGYAYRYPSGDGTVIRFNNGEEVNGSRPLEAVPYWLGAQGGKGGEA
ncbi:hypothetical protein [Burkholderia gladioli]|uniref:hypothetical protein n=1 Tax=Burkholderia gladioli TaxID=28095 RepID=UPI00163F6C13|nr:hypothetical protein [Burkholderia gladioli]